MHDPSLHTYSASLPPGSNTYFSIYLRKNKNHFLAVSSTLGTMIETPSIVSTSMHFLKRNPLYSTTKPYSLRFEPPSGFARSNITLERLEDLKIEDCRPSVSSFSLSQQGFEIMPLHTQMAYVDFEDDSIIVDIYLREIADALQQLFGASHVQIFEHTVRKRHAEFPIATGEPYRWNQPTSMAHVDTTATWVADMVRRLNGDRADALLEGRVQCVKYVYLIWTDTPFSKSSLCGALCTHCEHS